MNVQLTVHREWVESVEYCPNPYHENGSNPKIKVKSRTRNVSPASNGGECNLKVVDGKETEILETNNCPVDCVEGEITWSGNCVGDCGQGKESGTKAINVQPAHGGRACETDVERICDTLPPCEDCTLAEGENAWSVKEGTTPVYCPSPYENVIKQREMTRNKVEPDPSKKGKSCAEMESLNAWSQGELEKTETNVCPVDCIQGDWSEPTIEYCENNDKNNNKVWKKKTRTRTITPAQNNGKCDDNSTEDIEENSTSCPIDCELEPYDGTQHDGNVEWSGNCIGDCGTGIEKGERKIKVETANNGKECINRTVERECDTNEPCVDCSLGSWSNEVAAGTTPVYCPAPYQNRIKEKEVDRILNQPGKGGKSCEAMNFSPSELRKK